MIRMTVVVGAEQPKKEMPADKKKPAKEDKKG